jgi:hypothetical protein
MAGFRRTGRKGDLRIGGGETAVVAVGDRVGWRLRVVAATKYGQMVALTPADTDVPGRRTGSKTLGELLLGELERAARGGPPSGGHIPARTESPDPKRRAARVS